MRKYNAIVSEKTAVTDRCRVRVSQPPYYIYYHQCHRKWVTEIDGVKYCKQHGKKEQDYKDGA